MCFYGRIWPYYELIHQPIVVYDCSLPVWHQVQFFNLRWLRCCRKILEYTYRCGNLTFFSAILLVSKQNNPFSNQIGSTSWTCIFKNKILCQKCKKKYISEYHSVSATWLSVMTMCVCLRTSVCSKRKKLLTKIFLQRWGKSHRC
jgi:hypothetical protein